MSLCLIMSCSYCMGIRAVWLLPSQQDKDFFCILSFYFTHFKTFQISLQLNLTCELCESSQGLQQQYCTTVTEVNQLQFGTDSPLPYFQHF